MEQFSDEALKRTHSCGELRVEEAGKPVRLCGWVKSFRHHGGVIFIDLRDRDGVTQLVFDVPEDQGTPDDKGRYELARSLRAEWVISAAGRVRPRGEGNENLEMPTGQIEVVVDHLTVLNRSERVPFEPEEFFGVAEEVRLKYRFIDIRRGELTRALRLRSKICKAMRDVLDVEGFVEIETPFLTKSTPEGARDFLVPSRIQQGRFYALPQSPQLFKQILMVGGMDRYFQIVRCFRDEDLRADRQPEFTQLDIEMSFAVPTDVMNITNKVMRAVCEIAGKDFPDDVPIIGYDEAMNRYGTDSPDLRFAMELIDVSQIAAETDFKIFTSAVESGGVVKAIVAPGGSAFTRKQIDSYTELAGEFKAKGLAWCKVQGNSLTGGVSRFLSAEQQSALLRASTAGDGDIIFLVADKPATANRALGELRSALGADLNLYDENDLKWCWIVDFPLVERNEDEKRWDSLHHPFTSPRPEDLDKLASDPGAVRARAYDIVCNGLEAGGGSIRIHDREVQKQVFDLLGIGEEEAHERFDFLMNALKYGAPPHGGIALGLDRIVMILTGAKSLRDVIAFPKTTSGSCLMTGAPSAVDDNQLGELDLKVLRPHRGEDEHPEGE